MGISAIIANTRAVLTAAGYEENDPRHTLEAESDAGKDRRFTVEAQPITENLFRHGVLDNVRTTLLKVRLGFFAGGGDAGGAEHGGDMVSLNARAYEMSKAVASLLENPLRYNAQVTGIQTQNLVAGRGWDRVSVARRSEVWEVQVNVRYQQAEDVRAVVA